MTKDDYIRGISNRSSRFGSQLIRLMDRYKCSCLQEVTYEQAKTFYEEIVRDRIDDSKKGIFVGF